MMVKIEVRYYTTAPVDAFMGWDNSNAEFAFGSNVSVSGEVVTFNSLGNLRASYFIGNGSQLTGISSVSGNANYANYAGNAFSVSGSNVSGAVTYATTANAVSGSNVSGQVGNALVAGTVYVNAQPNITSVGTLSSLDVLGNFTVGAVITGVGAGGNITGANVISANVLTASGNITGGNANLGNSVTANFFVGSLYGTANLATYATTANAVAGANVSGQVGNANVASTVYTNAQPNITSLGTLTSLSVTGNITSGNAELGNSATANYFIGNLYGTANLATYATTANAVAGANVSGQVGNALIAGTVYTNAQPNITSVGTLDNLTVSGNTAFSGANVSLGAVGNLKITGGTANYVLQTDGAGNLSWTAQTGGGGLSSISNGNSNVNIPTANGNVNISTSGNANIVVVTGTGVNVAGTGNFTGNLTAGNFIAGSGSGGNISNANVVSANTFIASGNVTADNANLGNAVIANYFIGSGANLTSIPAGNISGQVANALIAGTVYTAAQPNITSIGSLSELTVSNATGVVNFTNTANVTLGAVGNLHISGGTANYVLQTDGAGNLSWAAQSGGGGASSISNGNSNVSIPSANGNINLSSAGNANVVVVTGTGANITGTLNVTGNTTIGNLITSGSGGNVSNVNVISANTFIASGNITASNANLGNAVTANYFIGNLYGTANLATYATTANSVAGANVSGQVGNALVSGTVYTNAQPNITSIGTLTDLSVSGNAIVSGNLVVSGTLEYTNVNNLYVKDPIIELGGGVNAAPLTTNDGKDRGTLLHYYTTAPVDAFMGWDNSNAEFAFGSNVSVSSEVVTFNSLGNVRANYFIGDGSQLTGLPASYGNSNVANYLPTYTGNLTAGNANLGNSVNANYFVGSGAFLTSVPAVTAGTVTTNAQPNITSVGTLTGLTIGNITENSTFGNGTITASGNISFTGANVSLGSVSNLKITGGTSGYFLTTDGAGNLSWGAANGGGGTSASGSNTQIQFNDGGVLGASANLTFDKTTNIFTTGRVVASGGANLGSNVANVYIGGGSNSQMLTTDGSGNLSWVAQPVAAITVDNFTGDGTTTAFTLSTTPTNINQTVVNYNGAFQLRAAYTVVGTTLTFSEAPINGSLIEVTTTMGAVSGTGAFITRSYTGNGVQTNFSVTNGCTVSSVIVTENGLVQTPTTDYTISGGTLTFNGAPANGIVINIRELAIATTTPTPGITWNIASSNITMTAGNGYFVDTSSSPKTMTLPASATLGDTIRINDLAGSFATNNLTVARNGHKIQGDTNDLLVDTDQTSFGLVYSNSTYGWKVLEL